MLDHAVLFELEKLPMLMNFTFSFLVQEVSLLKVSSNAPAFFPEYNGLQLNEKFDQMISGLRCSTFLLYC